MANLFTDLGFDMSAAAIPAGIPLLSSAIIGTTTNDSAAAGFIGEYTSVAMDTVSATGTVTTVVAATDLFTATAHGLKALQSVYFTTATTLPAGLSLLTNYYVLPTVTANTFKVATTVALALAGTAVDITDTGTGAHTVHGCAYMVTTLAVSDVCGLALTAGDWEVDSLLVPQYGSSTSLTVMTGWLSTAGASVIPATAATQMATGFRQFMGAANTGVSNNWATGTVRVSLAAAGMVVLTAAATFTVSTLTLQGLIRARRAR